MQVLKGRVSSNELMPYFCDLNDPKHEINTLFFHTRFSTNTDPHPSMAQPFRLMAHNGELNTDKKIDYQKLLLREQEKIKFFALKVSLIVVDLTKLCIRVL